MKKLLRSVLVILLCLNGVVTILFGLDTLRNLQAELLLYRFLVPGVIFCLLLGLTSVLLAVFAGRKPFLLISAAIVEVMSFSFVIASVMEISHHLNWPYLVMAIDAFLLMLTSIGLITLKPPAANGR